MVRAVCFDLMDTVLRDPYPEAVQAATGLELAAVRALKDPDAWPAFEVGAIGEAEYARRFFADRATERRFDLAAFHRARWEGYAFLPGMETLLDDTAGLVERHLVTNYPVWVEEVVERFRLRERVEGVWASHHLGVRKPSRAFFERLLEGLGHPPEACLLVDDRADNCAGAAAVGMRTHRFTDAGSLRARLRHEGLPV